MPLCKNLWTQNTVKSWLISRVGTLLYKPYMYVPPKRVEVLRHFGLKTGKALAYFCLESGMVFEGTTGVYERIYHFC